MGESVSWSRSTGRCEKKTETEKPYVSLFLSCIVWIIITPAVVCVRGVHDMRYHHSHGSEKYGIAGAGQGNINSP